MTERISARRSGMRISASVKWYDPAKGYGFLVPQDGSPDVYCRASALAAVGLDTLFAGATVDCETVEGLTPSTFPPRLSGRSPSTERPTGLGPDRPPHPAPGAGSGRW